MKPYSLAVLLFAVIATGCHHTTRSLDDLRAGPRIDPGLQGVGEALSDNRRQRLVDTLPPQMVPLLGESGILYVNEKTALSAVTRSDPPVPVEWAVARDGRAGTLGIYLRWSARPLSDCPAAGTSLTDGASALDLSDGVSHGLRRYYDSERGVEWDLNDPAFEDRVRYYFQGCLVDRFTAEFVGVGTNVVEAEIVEGLPDLVVQNAYVFRSGSRQGQIIVWVRDANVRSDILDREFGFTIVGRRISVAGTSGDFEISFNGTARLDPTSNAVIEPPASEFELPYDNESYEVVVELNPDRTGGMSESDYDNNTSTLGWMAGPAVVFVIENVDVKENCDQRSPGEWKMHGLLTNGFGQTQPFESNNALKVEDYTRYPTDPDAKGLVVFKAFNHPIYRPLSIDLNFEDCNHLFGGCPEEWREHPFGLARPSFPGAVSATLTPENRMRGDTVQSVARSGNCGGDGYVVRFRLLDPDRARAEGYEPDHTFYFPIR